MSVASLSSPSEGVAVITLHDPPMNFGTLGQWSELRSLLGEAETAGAKVAVITSDVPGYFIAHFSLQALVDIYGDPATAERAREVAQEAERRRTALDDLEDGPLITIAAVNGQAWGGGAELAWSCNLRIASTEATFGQPEVPLGIIPGAGGTTRLARLVGPGRCMELILDGRPMSAQRAYEMGAVNRVVAPDELQPEAIRWAAHIAQWPAAALQAAKRSLIEGLDMSGGDALANERRHFVEVATSDEGQARMAAGQAKYDAGADSYEAVGLERER